MPTPKYESTNRRSGEKVTGTWESVCDLDVRLYTRPKEIVDTSPVLVFARNIKHCPCIRVMVMNIDTNELEEFDGVLDAEAVKTLWKRSK